MQEIYVDLMPEERRRLDQFRIHTKFTLTMRQ